MYKTLLFLLCASAPLARADEPTQVPPREPPSAELLLFLAEFSDVSNEDFNLVIERGKQDVEQKIEPATAQRGDTDEPL